MLRILPLAALVLAVASPAAAFDGVAITPRLGLSLVVEGGPAGSGGTALGSARTVGVALGWPAISLVGDLGWRDASIPSSSRSKGWDAYETSDRTWSVGLRSAIPLDPAWDLAFELHVGGSRAENRAEGTDDIYVSAGESFFLWGAAAEALWSPKETWVLGLRVGFDDFDAMSGQSDLMDHDSIVTYERLSWSFGPVVGWHFE